MKMKMNDSQTEKKTGRMDVETEVTNPFLQEYMERAEDGDADAAMTLADIYQFGLGVEKNARMARKWRRRGVRCRRREARSGDSEAIYQVGLLYYYGQGVMENEVIAALLVKLSAVKGYGPAQYLLAEWYGDGRGVIQSHRKEKMWYGRAIEYWEDDASKGHPEALYWMGMCRRYGCGVEQDLRLYKDYMMLSAEGGYAASQYEVGLEWTDCVLDRDKFERGLEYLKRSAAQGYKDAYYAVAKAYEHMGEEEEAIERYTVAMMHGDPYARYERNRLIELHMGCDSYDDVDIDL